MTIKKYLVLFFVFFFPATLFAEDFVSCALSADANYSEKETALRNTHENEIAGLEADKDAAIKEMFRFANLRASLNKMKQLRTVYKEKAAEKERMFKENLELLSKKHNEEVNLCDLEKKQMATDVTP